MKTKILDDINDYYKNKNYYKMKIKLKFQRGK